MVAGAFHPWFPVLHCRSCHLCRWGRPGYHGRTYRQQPFLQFSLRPRLGRHQAPAEVPIQGPREVATCQGPRKDSHPSPCSHPCCDRSQSSMARPQPHRRCHRMPLRMRCGIWPRNAWAARPIPASNTAHTALNHRWLTAIFAGAPTDHLGRWLTQLAAFSRAPAAR